MADPDPLVSPNFRTECYTVDVGRLKFLLTNYSSYVHICKIKFVQTSVGVYDRSQRWRFTLNWNEEKAQTMIPK